MMYLWKIDKLVKDFQENKVSSTEEFKYYFTSTLLICLMSECSTFLAQLASNSSFNIFFLLITVFINGVGCYANFRLNQHGDDKDFIKRCFCLAIPLSSRVLICLFPFTIIIGLFANEKGDLNTPYGTLSSNFIYHVLFTWPYYIVFYYLLARKLEAIAYYTPPVFETSHDSN